MMLANAKVDTRTQGGTLVVYVGGYLNSSLGEEVDKVVGVQVDGGMRRLLLNFGQTRMVNSIGISFIIGVVEKVMEERGRMAFCEVNGINRELFQLTGLAKYVQSFDTEEEALAFLSGPADGPVS
ncbi:MAG: anti-anti-sigma factor [Deltaproteobacteria bacterium]|nr:anti-anti-sigma factor [Deltaproteobacteria bacterium]